MGTKVCLLGLALLASLFSAASAHNITKILSGLSEFSNFNSYLSQTKLADEINSRTTITVLAVDNAAMSALTGKNLGLSVDKNVLSLHVLLDYFDPAKLHDIANGTTLTTTLYQTTGNAQGNGGFLNITDLEGGKVGFGPAAPGSKLSATYVKSVKEIPYNISVIQISQLIIPSDLAAPAPSASQLNISAILAKAGCKTFLRLITATGVLKTYEDAVSGGLTLFAPTDAAFDGTVGGRLKKLPAAQQVSVLEYHALPVYSPLGTLKTTHGPISTLATAGGSKFALRVSSSGDTVALNTGVDKGTITGTVLDDQPVAVFTVDSVLEPREIFAAAAPAPAPGTVAAPSSAPSPSSEAPAPGYVAPSPSTTTAPASSPVLSPPAPLTAGPAGSPEAAAAPEGGKSEKGFAASLNRAGCWFLVLLCAACSFLML